MKNHYFAHTKIGIYHPQSIIGTLLIKKFIELKSNLFIFVSRSLVKGFKKDLHQRLPFREINLQSISVVQDQNKDLLKTMDIVINGIIPCYKSHMTIPQKLQSFYYNPKQLRSYLRQDTLLVQLVTIYHLEQSNTNQDALTKSIYSQKQIQYLISSHQKQNLDICLQQALIGKSLLIRTPIITACIQKPASGYCQNFDQLCQFYQLIGLGQIKVLHGYKSTLIDMAPADLLANFIIAAIIKHKQKLLEVINYSTCSRNPLSVKQLIQICKAYFKQYPLTSKATEVTVTNNQTILGLKLIKKKLPLIIKQQTGRFFNLQKLKVQSGLQLKKVQKAANLSKNAYQYLSKSWFMDTSKSVDLNSMLNPQQRQLLPFQPTLIAWPHYIRHSIFGMRHFIQKQKLQSPAGQGQSNLLKQQKSYFQDIYWAFTNGLSFEPQQNQKVMKKVLYSKNVRQVIRNLVDSRKNQLNLAPVSDAVIQQQLLLSAQKICIQMFSNYQMKTLRVFAYVLNKIFSKIYQKVNISTQQFAQLKKLQSVGPLILLPTHRSYIDFLIISFIFFCQGIKCPFIAAAQDFLSMTLVHHLLRASGAFFIKRNNIQFPTLYKAIMSEYVLTLLSEHNNIQFFVQGTRSRTGKMLPPKYGLLNIVSNAVETGIIKNAVLVPITINYQRVLQGETFPYQLLGQSKVKQTLARLIKASQVILDNYGRIFVQICKPIIYNQYKIESKKQGKQVVDRLGWQIIHRMSQKTVVMAPGLVSTVILTNRKGIRQSQLNQAVNWLSKLVAFKGFKLGGGYEHTPSVAVNDALKYLNSYVDKTRRNVFQVNISAKDIEAKNILMLAYYRNTITHLFFNDALICVALASFGRQQAVNGIDMKVLKARVLWLSQLIKHQYVLRNYLTEYNIQKFIYSLKGFAVITIQGDLVKAQKFIERICYFVWPIVQGYWLTFLYMQKYFKGQKQGLASQIQQKGYELNMQRRLQCFQSLDINIINKAIKKQSENKVTQLEIRPYLRKSYQDFWQQPKL